jgi:hypothetical protein
VRAHVRDVVDARRGLVGLFVPAFGGTLIAALGPASSLQRWLLLICAVALVVSVVDAVVLAVGIRHSPDKGIIVSPLLPCSTRW